MSYLYEACVCLGTVVYTTLGFILTYHVMRKASIGDVGRDFWSVVAMWLATPAIYYVIAEPSLSHGMTVFSMGVFFFVWYAPSPERSAWRWLGLGFAAGLVALVRWQDGIVAVAPLAELCVWVYRRRIRPANAIRYAIIYLSATTLAFSPQMIMWHTLYGSVLTMPQGEGFMRWMNPQVLPMLFSSRHGLVSWHPVFLLALLGIFALRKKSPYILLLAVYVFVAELYINSSAVVWWADYAFGGRRFVSIVPLFAAPLTAILARARMRWVVVIVSALVLWNALSLIQFRLQFVPMGAALSLREMTVDRLLIPLRLVQELLR